MNNDIKYRDRLKLHPKNKTLTLPKKLCENLTTNEIVVTVYQNIIVISNDRPKFKEKVSDDKEHTQLSLFDLEDM